MIFDSPLCLIRINFFPIWDAVVNILPFSFQESVWKTIPKSIEAYSKSMQNQYLPGNSFIKSIFYRKTAKLLLNMYQVVGKTNLI